jgi:hypothetical protein
MPPSLYPQIMTTKTKFGYAEDDLLGNCKARSRLDREPHAWSRLSFIVSGITDGSLASISMQQHRRLHE